MGSSPCAGGRASELFFSFSLLFGTLSTPHSAQMAPAHPLPCAQYMVVECNGTQWENGLGGRGNRWREDLPFYSPKCRWSCSSINELSGGKNLGNGQAETEPHCARGIRDEHRSEGGSRWIISRQTSGANGGFAACVGHVGGHGQAALAAWLQRWKRVFSVFSHVWGTEVQDQGGRLFGSWREPSFRPAGDRPRSADFPRPGEAGSSRPAFFS